MKRQYALLTAAALAGAALPLTAHATNYLAEGYSGGGYGNFGGNYLSNYGGGGFSGSSQLTNYGGGGYSPGGGYTLVNYGYSSGMQGPDTPHRNTWYQYQQLRANYEANVEATPICGAFYSRTANDCNQATTAWNPLINQ